MVFRYACTILDDPQGDNCSDLLHLPRMMAGTFLPASYPAPTHCLCSLQSHSALCQPYRTGSPNPSSSPLPAPDLSHSLTVPPVCFHQPLLATSGPLSQDGILHTPLPPAIMESTTALPNLFMPHPRDHSPHKEFSDWGAGAFSIKLISGRSVPR